MKRNLTFCQAWIKMQDALSHIAEFTSMYQEFTDFNKLSGDALDNFLSETELQDYEKQELKEAPDKNEYFKNWYFWYSYKIVSKMKMLIVA